MMNPIRPHRLGLLLLLALAACDTVESNEVAPQYLVESYQVALEPLKQVRLSRTAAVNATYDPAALAVRGATVQIHLLDAGGAVERTWQLTEQPNAPGVYAPQTLDVVEPRRTYRLDISIPGGDRVTAQTVVPDTFRVVRANFARAGYQQPEQIELALTPSFTAGRQNIYVLSMEALEPDAARLTPLSRQVYDDADDEDRPRLLEDLRISQAPPLNEPTFGLNPDGTLRLRLAWLMFAFYGPQRMQLSAIDDNLYDFMRSQQVQQGGSTLSPGEIPNIIDHVEGGTGFFSSYARVTFDVQIDPLPQP